MTTKPVRISKEKEKENNNNNNTDQPTNYKKKITDIIHSSRIPIISFSFSLNVDLACVCVSACFNPYATLLPKAMNGWIEENPKLSVNLKFYTLTLYSHSFVCVFQLVLLLFHCRFYDNGLAVLDTIDLAQTLMSNTLKTRSHSFGNHLLPRLTQAMWFFISWVDLSRYHISFSCCCWW